MAPLAVTVTHALPDEEVLRRLHQRYDALKAAYGQHLDGLEEQWGDHELRCRFTSFGMRFSGSATVGASEVCVQLDLPLLALAFKGMIERRIREELSAILA